jgi:hypothetical protein
MNPIAMANNFDICGPAFENLSNYISRTHAVMRLMAGEVVAFEVKGRIVADAEVCRGPDHPEPARLSNFPIVGDTSRTG